MHGTHALKAADLRYIDKHVENIELAVGVNTSLAIDRSVNLEFLLGLGA